MDRTKLKNYAPQARGDFIQAVTDRASLYGLSAKGIEPVTEKGDVAIVAIHTLEREAALAKLDETRWMAIPAEPQPEAGPAPGGEADDGKVDDGEAAPAMAPETPPGAAVDSESGPPAADEPRAADAQPTPEPPAGSEPPRDASIARPDAPGEPTAKSDA